MLQAHGYNSLGGSSSGQPQQMQAPQEPHPQASAFQQANGHLHAHHTNTDLGSGFSSGHSSGDLAQIPSPPPSQVSRTVLNFSCSAVLVCAVSSTACSPPLLLNYHVPSTLQCWHEWCAIPTPQQGAVKSQVLSIITLLHVQSDHGWLHGVVCAYQPQCDCCCRAFHPHHLDLMQPRLRLPPLLRSRAPLPPPTSHLLNRSLSTAPAKRSSSSSHQRRRVLPMTSQSLSQLWTKIALLSSPKDAPLHLPLRYHLSVSVYLVPLPEFHRVSVCIKGGLACHLHY